MLYAGAMQEERGTTPRLWGCFDTRKASSPTRLVTVEDAVDPLSVTHAPERIAEYRAAMQRGDLFPPVAVVRVAGHYLLADGHKRFSAYRALGLPQLPVEVWTLRRWAADQGTQFARKTRQQITTFARACFDPAARPAARRLLLDTLGHWRRIALSTARWTRRRA